VAGENHPAENKSGNHFPGPGLLPFHQPLVVENPVCNSLGKIAAAFKADEPAPFIRGAHEPAFDKDCGHGCVSENKESGASDATVFNVKAGDHCLLDKVGEKDVSRIVVVSRDGFCCGIVIGPRIR
jgi:hypothetical protein